MGTLELLSSYIEERYGSELGPPLEVAKVYLNELFEAEKGHLKTFSWGFYSYRLQGDAMIIFDIYLRPEARGKTPEGRVMWGDILRRSQEAGKRLIIGFSEKCGQNREIGRRAMSAYGFHPVFETSDEHVYWKGV